MSTENILFLSAVAFLGSFLVTPWARQLSEKYGMVDSPGDRKIHTEAVPYGGGLAIFFGFLLAVIFMGMPSREITGFLLGSFIVIILGIFDDILGLKALPKFVFQSAAALVAIFFGIQINMDLIFRGHLAGLSMLSIPVTYLWIVGITNAINIIDGLDGLAAGVSTISAFTIAAVAFANGQVAVGALALVIGFASLGFLPHNFHSKIFMGDSGSMFLGYSLAVLSILGAVKLAAAFSLFVPLMILAIPIFDTGFAMARRIINRQPIYLGDKKHIHHRLLDVGFSPMATVSIIYGLSVFFGALAIYSTTVRARTGYVIFGISLILVALGTLVITYIQPKKDE